MIGRGLERLLLISRWVLAPLYLGLAASMAVLGVRFATKLMALFEEAISGTTEALIVGVLSLIDLTLTANLVLLVVFVGWESFVSRLEAGDVERPNWMARLGFGDLKLKLMTAIVAISAIKLLEDFFHVDAIPDRELMWAVGLHVTFVVSAVIVAVMDRMDGH